MGSIDNGGRKVITQKMILEATPGSILASVRIDHEFSVLKVGNVGDWAVYSVNHWGDDKDSPAFATVALETIEHHCASFGSKRISREAFGIFPCDQEAQDRYCR
jgi:hypothetical protein